MDEKEKEKIRKEAVVLLNKFEKTLGSVKFKERTGANKVGGFREEGSGKAGKTEFRKGMFANAPQKEGDTIIAEKKSW